MNKLILFLFLTFILSVTLPHPPPSFCSNSFSGIYQSKYVNIKYLKNIDFVLNFHFCVNYLLISILVFVALLKMAQKIIYSTIFIPFNTILNLIKRKKEAVSFHFLFLFFMIPLIDVMTFTDFVFFLFQCDLLLTSLIQLFLYMSLLILLPSLIKNIYVWLLFIINTSLLICLGFHFYHILYTNYLPILNFILNVLNIVFIIPIWIPSFLIIISNDVHVNPGPTNNKNQVSFCNWNCNSLTKNNFNRVDLL